ncbi:hypothetical protein [Paenibacillus wynnii]|uniref:Uncharacterized protein n=1 Tax=Paenibacillus wynnii TaxID=268407 RepID=A0A098MDG2_9BACL|nr:hypothetical protein [Paenibacillus wynnii]KGE20610.1 hypothetical protein PWYN_15615 [Paenibacillus wynnii]
MTAKNKQPLSPRYAQVEMLPLAERSPEGQRMKDTYKKSVLMEEERLAVIEKYGPPNSKPGNRSFMHIPKKKPKSNSL